MRAPSLIISAAALAFVALAAGCGGGSSTTPNTNPTATPSPTASPSSSPTSSPTGSPSGSPAASSSPAATWTFGGASTTLSVTAGTAPGPASLTAYQNITAQVQFAASVSGSGSLNISDALNSGGDVTPNTLPADNATAGYTAVIYISVVNPGTADINFGQNTPSFTIGKSTGFAGATTCNLDVYGKQGNGTTPVWFMAAGGGTISGNTATLPAASLPAGNTVDFKPGTQQVIAVSCK